MGTAIVIHDDQMGAGDRALGQRLLKTFLQKAGRMSDVEALILYNGGVKVATRGSSVAAEIGFLVEKGVDVLACGTCVAHFDIEDQMVVDHVSNMDEIVSRMASAGKVITL